MCGVCITIFGFFSPGYAVSGLCSLQVYVKKEKNKKKNTFWRAAPAILVNTQKRVENTCIISIEVEALPLLFVHPPDDIHTDVI